MRIEYAKKEVERYKHDVEDWKQKHDEVARGCWPLEDLIANLNCLFNRILDIDIQVHEFIFVQKGAADPALLGQVGDLLTQWASVSEQILLHSKRVAASYGEFEGVPDLAKNARQARAILTPDSEFFAEDKLGCLEDEAIQEHRAGLTEPFLCDERRH